VTDPDYMFWLKIGQYEVISSFLIY